MAPGTEQTVMEMDVNIFFKICFDMLEQRVTM